MIKQLQILRPFAWASKYNSGQLKGDMSLIVTSVFHVYSSLENRVFLI